MNMDFEGPEQAFHWLLQARDLGSASELDHLIARCPADWGPRLVALEQEHAEEAARKVEQLKRVQAQIGVPPTSAGSVVGAPDEASSGWRNSVTATVLERLVNHADRRFRYRIGREIGRGGMGTVYAAHDHDLRREVALKVIREPQGRGLAQADYEALFHRFLAEAQVTAQLGHPGIVPIHDVGLDPDGRLFYTMPKIEGQSLSDLLRDHRSRPSSASLVRILGHVARVCETMEFAHSRGVVHRDLKPANVMVGAFGEVYVLDWGVAVGRGQAGQPSPITSDRQLALEVDRTTLCTHPYDRPGTPQYMAPEQARGETETIGPAVDVYAVGALLYRLLSGMAPYGHLPRELREDPARLLAVVVREPPRSLDDVAPTAPVELVAIVERAMCRDVDERYASMAELGRDLRAFVDGRVVLAYERGPWAEARKWVRRNRLAAAGIGVALVALVTGLVVVGLVARRTSEVVAKASDVLHETSYFVGSDPAVTPLLSGLAEVLSGSSGAEDFELLAADIQADQAVRRGDYEAALDKRAEILAARRERMDDEPGLEEREAYSIALVKLGDAHLGLGHDERALALYREARDIDEELAASRPEDAHLLDNLCWSYIRLGDFERNERRSVTAVLWYGRADGAAQRLIELSPDRMHSVYARSSVDRRLASELRDRGQLDEADLRARQALDGARRLSRWDSQRREFRIHETACLRAVATANAKRDPVLAFECFVDARDNTLALFAHEPQNHGFASTLARLEDTIGRMLARAERYEEALERMRSSRRYAQLAMRLAPAARGTHDHYLATTWIAELPLRLGRWAEALDEARLGLELVERHEELFGRSARSLYQRGDLLRIVGCARLGLGELSPARDALTASSALLLEAAELDREQPWRYWTQAGAARVALMRGELEHGDVGAAECLGRAVLELHDRLSSDAELRALPRVLLARVLLDGPESLRDPGAAVRLLEPVLARDPQAAPELDMLRQLARALRADGQAPRAEQVEARLVTTRDWIVDALAARVGP